MSCSSRSAWCFGISLITLSLVGPTSTDAAVQTPAPSALHAAEVHFQQLQESGSTGTVRPDGLVRAIAERNAMLQRQGTRTALTGSTSTKVLAPAAGITSATWTALGPGNIGGRIRAILIDPTTGEMFVGGAEGGIWVSANSGVSWSPVNDFMGSLSVSSLARNSVNDYLYAGTGEGFENSDAVRGAGIFESTDGGTTWNSLSSTNPASNPDWYYVNRIAINSTGTVILAATNGGVYRSTDNGSTWAEVYNTSISGHRSLDVAFDPNNASNAIIDTGPGTIAYSTDGGATWTSVTVLTSIPSWPDGHSELAYAPNSVGVVYASVDNSSTSSGQVYRSANGGQTWTLESSPAHLNNQGWYANTLWVDPTNAAHLIVGGLDLWQSIDSGATWTQISDWTQTPTSPHADQHVIVADPGYNGTTDQTVYFGNDGGLYGATDVTAVTKTSGWSDLNNGLAITQFYGGAGHAGVTATANGSIVPIIGGAQDNGTELYSGNVNGWTEFFGGDGGTCAVDPSDGNYLYGEYVYLQIGRSTDGGQTASYIDGGITDAGSNTTVNFIAPFVLDPNDATDNTMYAGGASLWMSANVKATTPNWIAIDGSTLPTSSPISAVTVAQGNANEIWVGHNDGSVYRQTGTVAAPVWTLMGGGALPLGRMVLSVYVDPNPTSTSETVYVTYGGYSADNVWRGVWNGTAWTWTDLTPGSSGFPQAPVYSLAVNPTNTSWLYAGTDVGVFTSTNGGSTWSTSNDGPANVRVNQLFWFNATSGSLELIAATHGRGMFETPVSSSSTPADPVPTISGLSKTSTMVGTAAFTLTVTGSGFVNGSTAQWNGSSLSTSVQSGTQLAALITAADLATAGTDAITVSNPVISGGGGTSASQSFAVDNPAPTIAGLSPASAAAGGAAFTLTVNGSGFVNGSTVEWNGSIVTTTYVSATQLTAAIPASDIASSGSASVTVANAAPGGGTSNANTFAISSTSSGGGGGGGCSLGTSRDGAIDPMLPLLLGLSGFVLWRWRRSSQRG